MGSNICQSIDFHKFVRYVHILHEDLLNFDNSLFANLHSMGYHISFQLLLNILIFRYPSNFSFIVAE
jgi:hypothetical protein